VHSAEIFAGVDPASPVMGIARGMRQMPAELPDDPAPEQVDAWIELGELATDERYWQLIAVINGQTPSPSVVPAFEWLIAALRATIL
jgi:hypothetical protein